MTRTYEKGRPTTGWRKGQRITSPGQVKPGDVLIGVSHQFEAENLYLVIPSPHSPAPHDGQGLYVRYAQPDLTPTYSDFQPQWVWEFQLAGPNDWYKAVEENALIYPLLHEFLSAYESTGMKPIRRYFCLHEDGVDYVCPLVALAIHRGVVDRDDPAIEIDGGANAGLDWAALTFGEDWAIGFLDGFDERPLTKVDLEYQQGYELGMIAAEQLSPRDPPIKETT